MRCKDVEAVIGCRRFPDGTSALVVIHYEYGPSSGGLAQLVATRYTDAAGVPVALGAGETVTPGACPVNDVELTTACYRVAGNAATYSGSVGDVVARTTVTVIDPETGALSVTLSRNYWYNQATGILIGVTDFTGAAVVGISPDVGPNDLVPCEQYQELPTAAVTGGGVNLAGAALAATAAFSGLSDVWSTVSLPDSLHSVTVSARGVVDGAPGQTADQVLVVCPDGTKFTLNDGETRTWSVVRTQDGSLVREYEVYATGVGYATVTYTYAQ